MSFARREAWRERRGNAFGRPTRIIQRRVHDDRLVGRAGCGHVDEAGGRRAEATLRPNKNAPRREGMKRCLST